MSSWHAPTTTFPPGNTTKPRKNIARCCALCRPIPTQSVSWGMLYQDQGQLPQAYALLQKAAELQPDDADLQTQAWRKPVGAG
jgi:hypothetical protein